MGPRPSPDVPGSGGGTPDPLPPARPVLTSTIQRRPTAPPPGEAPVEPAGPLPPVPVPNGHRSTQTERAAFRAFADSVWDRQAAAVTRTLTRMPALRGQEQEAARADLIALLLYLSTAEGPLGHRELHRQLRTGDTRLLPYAACVASALRRLPAFRGPVLCAPAPGAAEARGTWRPGTLMRDPTPVSGLPGDGRGPSLAGAGYAIWSVTGRRVRPLYDGTGSAASHDEVVFAPGTAFRVLDVRPGDSGQLVLLRELPSVPDTPLLSHAPLTAADHAVLARIDEALARHPSGTAAFEWPDRCSGPVGTAAG